MRDEYRAYDLWWSLSQPLNSLLAVQKQPEPTWKSVDAPCADKTSFVTRLRADLADLEHP